MSETLSERLRDDARTWFAELPPGTSARILEAADTIDALVQALELYNAAIRVDVLMEGPQFGGVNHSAMKRAWENGRAALAKAKGGDNG